MTTNTHNDPAAEPAPDPAVAALLQRGQTAAPVDVSADWGALQRELAAERGLGGLRSLATPLRVVLVLLVGFTLVVAVMFATPRPDLSVLPPGRMFADLVLLGVPLVAVVVAFMHPVYRPPLSPTIRWLAVGLAVFVVVASATLPAAHLAHPASVAGVGDDFVPRALGCFLFGVIVATPMVVIVRVFGRSGVGVRRFAPTLLVAAIATLVGCIALYMHCPITATKHLLAGHVTVWLPFAAVALLVGRRVGDG